MNLKQLITPVLLATAGFMAVAAWHPHTAPAHVAEAIDPGPVVTHTGTAVRLDDEHYVALPVVDRSNPHMANPTPSPPPLRIYHACETPDEIENWEMGGLRDPSCQSLTDEDDVPFKLIRKNDTRVERAHFDLIKAPNGALLYLESTWRTRGRE